MRIIGGTYRGKKLYSPASTAVRPTADRAREAVFNILNSKLGGDWSSVELLELFTGSGAFALEALSRGVAKVCMADIDLRDAKRNAALFPQEASKIKMLKADVTKMPQAAEKYNLLFMDAPYNQGLSEPALASVLAKGWLFDDCLCVVETEKNESFVLPQGFELIDERIYGLAKFWFLTVSA